MAKLKKKCCERFLKKTACKSCPLIAHLPQSKRKKASKMLRKQAGKKSEALA